MTLRLVAPFALLILSSAVPALAAAPNAPAEQAQSAEHADADHDRGSDNTRVVCRRETPTGSIRSKRVCRTVAQVAQDERDADRIRGQQNRAGTSAN
jgi:hypothetical protein